MRLSSAAKKHQELFARVLAAWATDGKAKSSSRGDVAPYLENFMVPHNIAGVMRAKPPINLIDRDEWIVGRPVATHEGELFPVASAAFKVEDSFMMGTIRIALLQGDGSGSVRAIGMRFESAESRESSTGVLNPHTYPHSQPARSWTIKGLCLLHPDAVAEEDVEGCPDCYAESDDAKTFRTEHFNAHRPAIPLRCETLPGLAIAAIVSVYGTQVAREIIDLDAQFASSTCPRDVFEDLQHILGEDDSGRFAA